MRSTTEEGLVDRVSVGLDVAGEAAEHVADRFARVLALKLEEDVVLVGEDDEKVTFPTRLAARPLASGSGWMQTPVERQKAIALASFAIAST